MAVSYEFDDLCNMFPDITTEQLHELANDIAENGLQNPIVRWEGRILDGKNRLKACEMSRVKPEFVDWYPTNPENEDDSRREAFAYVVSLNLHRRQLTESQLALIAGRMANMGPGRHTEQSRSVSLEAAANAVGISRRTVSEGKRVVSKSSPKVVDAVRSGEVSVSDAGKISELPHEIQEAALDDVKSGTASTLVLAVRDRKSQFTPEDFDPSITAEKKWRDQSAAIESFCRTMADRFKECPRDEWLDDGHFKIANDQLKQSLSTLRLSKGVARCHHCDGSGCDKCRNTGFLIARLAKKQ